MHILILCEFSNVVNSFPQIRESVRQLLSQAFDELDSDSDVRVGVICYGNKPSELNCWRRLSKSIVTTLYNGFPMGVPNLHLALAEAARHLQTIPRGDRALVVVTYAGACDYDTPLTPELRNVLSDCPALVVMSHPGLPLPEPLHVLVNDITALGMGEEQNARFAARFREIALGETSVSNDAADGESRPETEQAQEHINDEFS